MILIKPSITKNSNNRKSHIYSKCYIHKHRILRFSNLYNYLNYNVNEKFWPHFTDIFQHSRKTTFKEGAKEYIEMNLHKFLTYNALHLSNTFKIIISKQAKIKIEPQVRSKLAVAKIKQTRNPTN